MNPDITKKTKQLVEQTKKKSIDSTQNFSFSILSAVSVFTLKHKCNISKKKKKKKKLMSFTRELHGFELCDVFAGGFYLLSRSLFSPLSKFSLFRIK